ncbi:MAG: hypothetical protein AAGI45_00730 [Cyanobacteria bacterium P01_H01_bin.26]
MSVLTLKTELDVAALLLAQGWFPEEINGILVFPLPRSAFRYLSDESCPAADTDVVKATDVTPTTISQARQLLESSGWMQRELDSLLKPYGSEGAAVIYGHLPRGLGRYRRRMALRRILSLALVMGAGFLAVVVLG